MGRDIKTGGGMSLPPVFSDLQWNVQDAAPFGAVLGKVSLPLRGLRS
jgi:hypothetical protein